MFGLDELLGKQLQKGFRPEEVLFRLMDKRLQELGVKLKQSQKKELRKQLKTAGDSFSINISDKECAKATITDKEGLKAAIAKSLEDLPQEIINTAEKFIDEMPNLVNKLADIASEVIFKNLRRRYRGPLNDRLSLEAFIEDHIFDIWGKSINQLRVLLGVAIQAGEYANQVVAQDEKLISRIKWEILRRLHGRAIQITGEIIALLESGYPDGAKARWRSLHELSVVAQFIYDNDDDLAERYLLHDEIEEYKSVLQQYDIYPDARSDDDFMTVYMELKTRRQALVEQYGTSFGKQFGWAAQALQKKEPNFSDIEKVVDLSYIRPYYRKASHCIHAEARGILAPAGMHEAQEGILAGPSDYGLADPGHHTAHSLVNITNTLLVGIGTFDSVICMKVLLEQMTVVGREFRSVQRRMEKACMVDNDDLNMPVEIENPTKRAQKKR